MSDLITFRLSANHARALVALGTDHTAPALARAAADLVWQQISGPAPVTDAGCADVEGALGRRRSG